MDKRTTAGIMSLGGTILGTTNKGHLVFKGRMGEKTTVKPGVIEDARQMLKKNRNDGLIIIGGDGALTTAQQFFEAGLPIIGVPKTIDNDLEATR